MKKDQYFVVVGRNMRKGEAVANFARLSMKANAKDVSGIAERKDRDLMFFYRRFDGPKQTSDGPIAKQTSGLQSAS